MEKSGEFMNEICKISILVPVYNTEFFLRNCLDSLINQTFKDIEIICVNDGSTDTSLDILKEYSQKDSRIKIVSLEKNEGLARARYHGIINAKGKYIMFVDSDDYLELSACEKAYQYIEKYQVDILHFSTNILPFGLVDMKDLNDKRSFVDAYVKKLSGDKIFSECYLKHKFGWNLWNKIYKSEVVKAVAPYIPNKRCIISEDMFIFSMIIHFSKTYYGVNDRLYNYRFGSGVSTIDFSIKQFDSYARNHVAISNMYDFHKQLNIYSGDRKKFIEDMSEEFRNVMLWHFMYSVSETDAHYCFDKITSLFSIEEIIDRLLFFDDIYTCAKRIAGSKFLINKGRKIKNIAIFYYKYSGGGVERVMSKLIPMFESMGYNLTLIIEKDDEKSFPLPSSCKKEIISTSINVDKNGYMKHAKELKDVIVRNNIDLVLYQASNSPFMLYDILVTKSLGAYFVATTHDFITSPLLYRGNHFSWKPQVLKLTDLVQTITQVEKDVYLQSGINACYIPNPLTFNIPEKLSKKKNTKNLLWVGRIDPLQKNPADIIYILLEIKRFIPDIKLTILGAANSKKDEKLFRRFINSQNLNKNITWIQNSKNIEEYYKNSDLLIMTSSYEVYPMVLGEAMSYGLPIVTYDMPYVELLKNNKAVVSVQPNSIILTAKAIMDLISDDAKMEQLRHYSYEYIKDIAKTDLPSIWKEEIIKLENHENHVKYDENLKIFFDVMYEHYAHPKDNYLFYRKSMIIPNLFRYFKKFGIMATIKKIRIYIKKYGIQAAIKKGRIRI